MLCINVLLAILFAVCNLIYVYFGSRFPTNILWSPLWLTYYNAQEAAQLGHTLGVQEPNFGFYFFWILMVVNIYFLFRLQKSANTKQ